MQHAPLPCIYVLRGEGEESDKKNDGFSQSTPDRKIVLYQAQSKLFSRYTSCSKKSRTDRKLFSILSLIHLCSKKSSTDRKIYLYPLYNLFSLLPVPRRAGQTEKLFLIPSPTCSRVSSCSKKSRTGRKIVLHKTQSNLLSRYYFVSRRAEQVGKLFSIRLSPTCSCVTSCF